MPVDDIIGNKIGELTVTNKKERKNGRWWYECVCSCGNKKQIIRNNLISNHTKSCGCLKNRHSSSKKGWSGFGEISGRTWYLIKQKSEQRNIKFDISIEYAWDLFEKQNRKCAYSGMELSMVSRKKKYSEKTASLDRINNELGYIVGNVHWVHKHVNIMKHKHDECYFLSLCKLITENQNE